MSLTLRNHFVIVSNKKPNLTSLLLFALIVIMFAVFSGTWMVWNGNVHRLKTAYVRKSVGNINCLKKLCFLSATIKISIVFYNKNEIVHHIGKCRPF